VKKKYYFDGFEDRKPYPYIPDNAFRTKVFQFFGILTITLGLGYLHWRWRYSLNFEALWFAIPLVLAETLSFVGTVLSIINFWANKDREIEEPVHYLSDIEALKGRPDRPVRIDVFIASYNEDVEVVRLSIQDAKKMTYPFPDVPIKIFVLDDGRRDGRNPAKENMKVVCEEEGIGYFNRETNEGYKAGNLQNGLEKTIGDIIVILDADTRPFTTFLERTLGYFKDRKLAWVQTPQWFYDITAPIDISVYLKQYFGKAGAVTGNLVKKVFGKVKVGEDIFGNDPQLFYDVILRRRNYFNAAFCCGAGSIHRREAIMSLAVSDFAEEVRKNINKTLTKKERSRITTNDAKIHKKVSFLSQQMTPFKFHASEDIYTSIMLHADYRNQWKSYQHHLVECKMLSPQDVDTWVKQRMRYATGSLDIAFNDNPIFRKGLTLGQRVCYFATIYSYFAPLWIVVFLLSPIIFFFTQALPVQAYSFDFLKYFIPFQIFNTITMTVGCWGIKTNRGDQYYISCFWMMLLSLISAVIGKEVKFNVTPKEKQGGNEMQHILPHLVIIGLTVTGILYNIVLILLDMHPSVSGFISNTFWSLFNIFNLSIMIRAAYWKDQPESEETPAVEAVPAIAMA
jgi:cellulose synthase (UDP-forming)